MIRRPIGHTTAQLLVGEVNWLAQLHVNAIEPSPGDEFAAYTELVVATTAGQSAIALNSHESTELMRLLAGQKPHGLRLV